MIINCRFSSSSKGDRFFIGENTTCTNVNFIGHDASPTLFIEELSNNIHPCLPYSRKSYRKPIYIGNNVFIGFNAIILPGVQVCDNCVIAAGSVVNKNITMSGVYGGNPVRKINEIDGFIEKYTHIYKNSPQDF